MSEPWTLRDLRRALAHAANRDVGRQRICGADPDLARPDGMPSRWPDACVRGCPELPLSVLDGLLRSAGITSAEVELLYTEGPALRQIVGAVDRAIRRFGPDHRIDLDNSTRGGDDDEDMTGPREPRSIALAGDVPASSGGDREREDRAAAGPDRGSDEETAGEETSPTATSPGHPPAEERGSDGEHCTDAAAPGRAETGIGADEGADQGVDDGTDDGAACGADDWRGGGALCITPASVADVRDVAEVLRALQRLAALARRQEPTPRWDAHRVVRELVSRQVRLHRMRQDAPTIRAALLVYDLSGSCAWIAARLAGIATWLAAHEPRIVVAPTGGHICGYRYSEGIIVRDEISGRSPVLQAIRRLAPEVIEHAQDYHALRRVGVSHMLVLGDAHGHEGYQAAVDAGIDVRWVNPNPDIAPDAWEAPYRECDAASLCEAIIEVCHPR